MAKIHLQKKPATIIENGKNSSKFSQNDLQHNSGWYYDAIEKILWLKTAGNNKIDTDLKIIF